MSHLLISHSPDLKRLRDEGYAVEIHSGYVVLKDIPYVTPSQSIQWGMLVSELTLAGNITTTPSTHVVYFAGEYPCHRNGRVLQQIKHESARQILGLGLVVDHSFSSKPEGGYRDYYHKMTTYAAMISHPALALNPTLTLNPFPVMEDQDDESVFTYIDTASSRAEIGVLTSRLAVGGVGIVGLGGTGSYILDLLAKTPVKEIRLFDGDTFLQHNAFRAPGAASLEDLNAKPTKVDYLKGIYSRMHRNIVAYNTRIDVANVDLLQGLDFVFLCLDKGEAKRQIVEALEVFDIPFIDVGMGIEFRKEGLGGILRVTTSTTQNRERARMTRIPFSDGDDHNEYAHNIQVADLNALNATLAVIKWKKFVGFYEDLEGEYFCTYTLDGNHVLNEDQL